ncbi:MAG: cell division protein FtsA [SAR202 cluster bacterium Io17-Chloro-G9]|nr:MAG: cell division protein FtsA [SAR202 cluster bacterium Io17-Chloro-G9]
MAKEIFYTAVDIGTSKVCSIVARVGTEGELKILGTGVVASQGVQKGRIENIDEVQAAVRSSLEESQRYIGRGVITGVYAGVSGTHITCLNTKDFVNHPDDGGQINSDKLRELIESAFPQVEENQEVLHVIPIGYQLDGLSAVRNPIGLHAGQVQVEAHVVLGDATVLRNTVKAVEGGKVAVKSLVVHSLASAEATLTGDEREMGVVLVDIGGGTSDVMIYRQGNPWYSSVIPVGGNQLTRDLAVAMRIPFYVAEEIKIKWGHALPEMVRADEEVVVPGFQGQPRRVVKRRIMGEPLHARLVELLKLVLLRVRQAGLRQLPTGGLVITGGCAEMEGLQELAQKTLGGPVRIAYPRGIAGLPTQLRKPSFSAGIGLLLWGIKHQGEKRRYRNGQRSLWGGKGKPKQVKNDQEANSRVSVG